MHLPGDGWNDRMREYYAQRDGTRVVSPITKSLYLGGEIYPDDVAKLETYGVKYVVNVAKEIHDTVVAYGHHMISFHFPFRDHVEMPPWMIVKTLETLRECLKRGPTLVHCGVGISRSPTTIALYWYAMGETQSVREGVERLKALRSCVAPWPELLTPKVMNAMDVLRRRWTRKHRAIQQMVSA